MNSNKLLLIFLTIGILMLLGYFVKRKKDFIKINNNDYNEINNNDYNEINKKTPVGEISKLKLFSTFIPNIELFNIKTNTFYKDEPYSYLKKTIKEGVANSCNKLSNILFSYDGSCEDNLSNIATIVCDDNKKVMTLNGKNGSSIECVNHDAHLNTCKDWNPRKCCGENGAKLISLYDKQGNKVDDKCTATNPCAPYDWDNVTMIDPSTKKTYPFKPLEDCKNICKENINCNNCISTSYFMNNSIDKYRPVSTKKNEFIECKVTQS